MSLVSIQINIHAVKNISASLSKDVSRLSNLENEVTSLKYQLDWRIKERGNLHQRIERSCRSLKEIEDRVRALEDMIQRSMKRYEKAEDSLVKEANQMSKIEMRYGYEMIKYTNTQKNNSSSSMLKTTVSTGADFIPSVGNAKSLVEAVTGKDVITRENLSTAERIIAVSGIVGGGAVKGIAKGALKVFSKIGSGAVKKGFKISKTTKFKKYKTNAEKGANIDTKDKGNPLLLTEGKVGTFKELAKQGTAFDNITPHHMPSAAKMKQAGVKRNNGVSMNMEQPHPGVGGRHRETYTYGLSGNKLEEYLNLSYRDVLAHDILDARRIYMKDGVYTPEIREGLLNTIKKNGLSTLN